MLATASKRMAYDETIKPSSSSLKIFSEKVQMRKKRVLRANEFFDLFVKEWLGLFSRKCAIYIMFNEA